MSALAAALVLGQLAGLVPAGPTSSLTLSDRSEARIRKDPLLGMVVDLETAPAAGLTIGARHASLTLGYGARIADLDVGGENAFALFHSGRAAAAWWTNRLRLTLGVDGSIGSSSSAGLPVTIGLPVAASAQPGTGVSAAGPGVSPTQTLPAPAYLIAQSSVIRTGALSVNLHADYGISKRWIGGLGANYGASGGLDFVSQQLVPPNRNVGGDLRATYRFTALDSLGTGLSGVYTRVVTTGANFVTVQLLESWNHNWTRRTQSSLGAGASYLSAADTPGVPRRGSVNAAGQAALNYSQPLRHEATLRFGAVSTLGTAYNPLLGLPQTQLSAAVSASWAQRPFNVQLGADYVTSVPTYAYDATHAVSGSVGLGYSPSDWIQVQLGARAYSQVLNGPFALHTPPGWTAFLALLLRAPVMAL